MSYLKGRVWRSLAAGLITASLCFTLLLSPVPAMRAQAVLRTPSLVSHDDSGTKKKTLTRKQQEREAWVWHESNVRRLEETHALGAEALTTDIPNQDTNDISVIQ